MTPNGGGDDAAARHERAGILFLRLRQLADEERGAALDEACGDDGALRAQVVALLRGDVRPGLDVDRLGEAIPRAAHRIMGVLEPERPLPSLIGSYRIVRRLGEGGMGVVLEAVVETSSPTLEAGTSVALKVLHPHLMKAPGSAERLRREGAIGQSLRHSNVVRAFDCDSVVEDGRRIDYLVMELVHGQTLHALQQEMGCVPEELCRHVAREVAVGLAAMHEKGIVHRDLKPDNVIVTSDNVVKIMDLGVARATSGENRLTGSGAFVGSLPYAAAEQLRGGGTLDGRTDLYALGVVLYELTTGSNPFRGDDQYGVIQRVLHETPRRLGLVSPQVTPFFEELVHALLEKNRDRRIPSAQELADILELGEESLWWMSRSRELREAASRPLRRVGPPRASALVGRGGEIASLRDAFGHARDGNGKVVLIEGEAGIGKTRLVDELVALLERDGEDFELLRGRHDPGGLAGATGAFQVAFREHWSEGDLDDDVAAHLREAPELAPAFAAFLASRSPSEGVPALTQASMHACFVHATHAMAARRVAIVFIDDLHFARQEGRSLFASMAAAVAGHRILLVGTARPSLDREWAADLERKVNVTRIRVGPLNAGDLAGALAQALASQPLAEELALRLADRTGGNPYFLFEVLRGLEEERSLLQRSDGGWAMAKDIHDVAIPASIGHLIAARLSELSVEERSLLEVAACVGFEFDPQLVGEVSGLARLPLLKSLGRIERRHRLIRAAGRRYVFEHHLVQEILDASLDDSVRTRRHAGIAEALERTSGAASRDPTTLDGALCVSLVEHMVEGGLGSRALRYFERARAHLRARYRSADEVALAERMLAVPGLLDGAERVEALIYLCQSLQLLRRSARHVEAAREAEALIGEGHASRLHPHAAYHLALALANAGRFADAEGAYRRAIVLGREHGVTLVEAAAEVGLNSIFNTQARWDDALPPLERALALYRGLGDVYGEAVATANMSNVLVGLHRVQESVEHCQRAIALGRAIDRREHESIWLGNLGASLRRLGRLEGARQFGEEAVARAREGGDRQSEGRAMSTVGAIMADGGHDAEAREHLLHSWTLMVAVGAPFASAWNTSSLVAVELRAGRLDAARACIEERLAVAREKGEEREEALILALATRLPGADVTAAERAFAAHGSKLDVLPRMEAALRLFEATGSLDYLRESRRLCDESAARLSDGDRAARLARVRECREVLAAVTAVDGDGERS